MRGILDFDDGPSIQAMASDPFLESLDPSGLRLERGTRYFPRRRSGWEKGDTSLNQGRRTRHRLLFLSFLALLSLGHPGAQEADSSSRRFCSTKGPRILDPEGRVLLLHGVNYSGAAKSEKTGFLPWQNEEETKVIKKWGFNSVRYLIIWEAVEPEPGVYDEDYLDRVAERLRWCKEAGLWVILDMHQDLYSRKYGADGAPEWACLDDGIPFVRQPGGWFMNYPTPAVMRCFDNFWDNKEGPGGVGVMDRYVAMWQHVAERFREAPHVIGYDVMNEPFYGSAVMGILCNVIYALKGELGEEFEPMLAEFREQSSQGSDPMVESVQRLIEQDKFFGVMDRASWASQRFETMVLQAFYNEMAKAIRDVDPNHVVVFEPAGGGGAGTRLLTAIAAPKDENGIPFQNVVFSPHHYEFAADLGFPYDPSWKSVRRGLYRAHDASQRMVVPVWYGEWGAWTGIKPGTLEMIREHLDSFDEMLCGWAYWDYGGRDFKDSLLLPMLGRPYASAVAGVPEKMQCLESSFELRFRPSPEGGETVIWVPAAYEIQTHVETEGEPGALYHREDDGSVSVICPAGIEQCHVNVTWNDPKAWFSPG